jgi:hypothetical protein
VSHKTLSLRREEHFDDGAIFVIDITKRPVRILRMEPDTQKATLQILYNMKGAKNPDMLAMLAGMRVGSAEQLGAQEIKGIQAEGFRKVDPHNDITIWADMDTGLPVRIEIIHPKRKQKIIMDQFDFETELDDSLFLTDPPEGFDVKEQVTGLEMKAGAVTKQQVRENATMPVYVFKSGLSWTKLPSIIEASDLTVPGKKMYIVSAVGNDGRHVALGQSQTNSTLRNQIHSGGNKCLEQDGFVIWNGGPEKWYSKTTLESAEGMIPPGISEDRTGYAIETPEDTIIIVGINGALSDAELKELIEALELCTEPQQ